MGLKKGYTTGVHTSFAFKSALDVFTSTKQTAISYTNKMDNDDLDVTKGCEIVVCVTTCKDELKLNKYKHKPYIFKNRGFKLQLFAGDGVGVVSKDGLKPPKNYPAINPTPLSVLEKIYLSYDVCEDIFVTVSVTDGENIAKQTANSKVGVLGGISILGTTGFVKPVSADAYIDSIEQELNFAYANGFKKVVFTLGNTAYKKAVGCDGYIVEVGNFIYDGIKLSKRFDEVVLMVGIAKLVKIAQGFKNTHNRFGSIDFVEVSKWCGKDVTECLTIKGVREILGKDVKKFDEIVKQKATKQLFEWFGFEVKVEVV